MVPSEKSQLTINGMTFSYRRRLSGGGNGGGGWSGIGGQYNVDYKGHKGKNTAAALGGLARLPVFLQ